MVSVAPAGVVRDRKASLLDLKLKRMNELVVRLQEDLNRPRVPTSEACQSIMQYTKNTKDFLVPSVWGPMDKREDPYSPPSKGGCCSIM
ncbi:GGL domain-containing protein [Lipomyces arxii]|uniref:GGL domain-containing protein n=1 Tax=Lipomyces arxii TaxID=56418 RepID=UPI0034CED1EA